MAALCSSHAAWRSSCELATRRVAPTVPLVFGSFTPVFTLIVELRLYPA